MNASRLLLKKKSKFVNKRDLPKIRPKKKPFRGSYKKWK